MRLAVEMRALALDWLACDRRFFLVFWLGWAGLGWAGLMDDGNERDGKGTRYTATSGKEEYECTRP